jgi:hypothetical protein
MQPSTTTDPVKYPTINLGGKEYELKYRLSDMVNLAKEHQIDLFVKTETIGVAGLERLAKVIAAGLTHTGEGITYEHVLESIDVGEVPIYSLAVIEAQKKASPSSQKALKAIEALVPKKKETTVQ